MRISSITPFPVTSSTVFASATPRFAYKADSVRFGAVQKPRERSMIQNLRGENVKIAWREFGNPDAENVIVAVHGYTRNSHDFDYLASQLAGENTRVICPDIVGRGNSGWFRSPFKVAKYEFSTYIEQLQNMFDELSLQNKNVTWIGTSMGGALGMMMAAKPNTPIKRLVLNDIGPRFTTDALDYLACVFKGVRQTTFRTVDEALPQFKERMKDFGDLTDDAWRHLTFHTLRFDPINNVYRLNYDPAITEPFNWMNRLGFLVTPFHKWMMTETLSLPLQDAWRNVRVPVLALWGENSRVLDAGIVRDMKRGRDNVTVLQIPNVGHAPALMDSDQVGLIRNWIEETHN